jgi:hypothetical protein
VGAFNVIDGLAALSFLPAFPVWSVLLHRPVRAGHLRADHATVGRGRNLTGAGPPVTGSGTFRKDIRIR